MKLVWKSCVRAGKEALRTMFMKISRGVKFQEIADIYNGFLDRFSPHCLHRPLQYILTFFLFHLYLLYAVLFGITQFIILHAQIKGARIIPLVSSISVYKEKMIMFITSIFVWHWLSTSVLGISTGWKYLSSWVVNLRPQISIRPQLKLVSLSDSCHSNASKMSLSMEEMDADVNVYLSPEQEELANVMNFKRASSTASFASDLVSSLAASVTQTDSYDSSLSEPSGQEIDLDEEMEKVRLTEHLNTSEGSLRDEKEEEAQYRRARLSFREVANEVLTKALTGPDGVRSRIARPEALRRFNARNAIANTILRQHFLRRNTSPNDVDSHFNLSDF